MRFLIPQGFRCSFQPTGLTDNALSGDRTSKIGTGVKRSLILDIEETPISVSVGKSMHVVKTVCRLLFSPKNVEVRWFLNWPACFVNARNLRGEVVISSFALTSTSSEGNRSRSSPFLTKR